MWRQTWRLNVIIALFSSVTLVVAWLTYLEAQRQADIAFNALVANQRPWVAIKDIPIVKGGLNVDQTGSADTNISIPLANVGKSPAVRVHAFAKIVSIFETTDLSSRQLAICREMQFESAPKNGFIIERTLMPDETASVPAPVTSNIITRAGDVSAFNYIVGYIDYKMNGSTEHHTTPFIYDIQTKSGLPIIAQVLRSNPQDIILGVDPYYGSTAAN